jgi:hypothetical protein
MAQVLDYFAAGPSDISPLPVLHDWATLSQDQFMARFSNQPVILAGLGSGTAAMAKWDRGFFQRYGNDAVTVRRPGTIDERPCTWVTQTRLRDFIAEVGHSEGLYIPGWYVFKSHPELFNDLRGDYPPYLLDDWFEAIPAQWAFDRNTRNYLYWGAHGSSTSCHYDTLRAVTWNTTLRGSKRWLLFSCRELLPEQDKQRRIDALKHAGLLGDDYFATPERIQRYLTAPPAGLPRLEFFAGDVPAGSTIYVPWEWAHQVHNLGETLAVSRYYLSRENAREGLQFLKDELGTVPGLVFQAIIGGERRRRFWRQPLVRSLAASAAGKRLFQALMKLGGLRPNPFISLS